MATARSSPVAAHLRQDHEEAAVMVCPRRARDPRASASRSRMSGAPIATPGARSPIRTASALHEGTSPSGSPPRTASIPPFAYARPHGGDRELPQEPRDRKSTRLNSSHGSISYAVFCLKKKKNNTLTKDVKDNRYIIIIKDPYNYFH